MSNVSIYGKNWIDLVFEGKNKSYGAYQLRQQSEKTTLTAFLYALLLFAGISGIITLLSSFSEKPVRETATESEPLTVAKLYYPPKQPAKALISPVEKQVESKIEKKIIRDPQIVNAEQKPDDVATNAESKSVNNVVDSGSVTGSTTEKSNNGTTTVDTPSGPAASSIPDNTLVATNALDKLPEFPGGIKKFYEFVGRNFERPEVEFSQRINVLMYFVIEKDGSMTDIKVLQNPGHGLDKEAIRVLKSLRTKWTPGIKNGKPMRTAYMLPIAIQPVQ